MKQKLKISNFILLVLATLIIQSCQSEQITHNHANVTSFPLHANLAAAEASVLDFENRYLYVLIRYGNTIYSNNTFYGIEIKKIEVETLKEMSSIFIPDLIWNGSTPMEYIGDGQLLISAVNNKLRSYHLVKISSNFEVDTILTIPEMVMFTSRLNSCVVEQNKTLTIRNIGTNSLGATQLKVLDDNMEVQQSFIDGSYMNSTLYSGSDLIKTSNNNYLYLCQVTPVGETNSYILLELRDQNFELLWRKQHKGDGSYIPSRLNEYDDKFYIYCVKSKAAKSSELTIITYNYNGDLVNEKQIGASESNFKTSEQIVQLNDGGFLVPAVAPVEGSSLLNKGVVYKVDKELNILSQNNFGGDIAIAGGDLHKIDNEKYLLVYTDNSYTIDRGEYRLVFQYIDENGNLLQ